ncbi:MAG: conjugal transfer protein TraX [Firmicutes bacterium]|nr:conjugal transfer protein TraX [Bacillota bacterium]
MRRKTCQVLNGFHLKLIAACTMFIDHMGHTLFPTVLWLRCIGRLAFPIFCFLIAEGCVYTRDRRKYALRLLVFALLSEVPFDLMVGGTVWYPYSQNVLWTLLAGALICWCVDWALRKKTPAAFLLTGAAVAAAFCLLELAGTDYRGWGMLLVVLFYGVRRVSCGTVVKRTAQAVDWRCSASALWAACPSNCGRWRHCCPSGSTMAGAAIPTGRCSTAFTPFTPCIS